MRIVFFGTPDFAVPSLHRLVKSGHEVIAVVTQPDRPAGRKRQLRESSVKLVAQELEVPLQQPDEITDPTFLKWLKDLQADIGVVVAFTILPEDVYNIPKHGCINLHASLLPDLRGAAPITHALFRGYDVTGLTTFKIEKKVDTGGILLQQNVIVMPEDNHGTLSRRMSHLGADLILSTVDQLRAGALEPSKQQGVASLAPKIERETCRIDWSKTSPEIHNLVRGLSPQPGAFTTYNGKTLKIYTTSLSRLLMRKGEPGSVVVTEAGKMMVKTGKGVIEILELQLEGRNTLETTEFLKGFQIPAGTRFGD
ncbi:methionyl-tRNA formyltransferase [Calditrichota bacterium]